MIIYGDPSGGRADIAKGELEALMELSGEDAQVEVRGGIVACGAKKLPPGVRERASFLSDVGVLLLETDRTQIERLAGRLDFSSLGAARFKVDSEGFTASTKRRIDEAVGEKVLGDAAGSSVSMKSPQKVIRVVSRGENSFVGMTSVKGRGKWIGRRPRARPFFHPSALFPKLARLMVNLSAVAPGETFLDPFSGTCSTVIEAAVVGAYGIGMDVDKRMVFGGRRNLRGFSLQTESQVVHGDARFLPFVSVDAIAGDVPYGRASSTKGALSSELVGRLLDESKSALKPGGRLVIMHQKAARLDEPKGFEALGEYEFYVHRSLTRVISVLRRR
jgi:putative methyltransferase (TIGR01177 family)